MARTVTPARLVAVTLLTVLTAGLVLLHLGGTSAPVRVPTGAKAGSLRLAP